MKGRAPRARELSTVVTYLAMEKRQILPPPPTPLLKVAILKCDHPPVHFYRYLYDAVGRPYFWVERRLWSNEQLKVHLAQERIALYVLYIGGVPGGMVELDLRDPRTCQISYFGLTQEFVGRGIGPWFLHQIIEIAWAEPVSRLTLNTCTLDHRKALATYQRAGFVPYARAERVVVVPADFPEP